MKQVLINTILYLALLFGWAYLYQFNIEEIVYPDQEIEIESDVDFIYQQF